jgi:hypothetical protein
MMADMTDEEYDELDELLTRTVPKLGPNGTGFFSSKGFQMIAVDEPTACYLKAESQATRQTLSELVAAMVRREIAARA